VRRADNLTTFMCRLSKNLGASTSWDPKGLSRPAMGLLFICIYIYIYVSRTAISVTQFPDDENRDASGNVDLPTVQAPVAAVSLRTCY
jgi:hypothetical protein